MAVDKHDNHLMMMGKVIKHVVIHEVTRLDFWNISFSCINLR